MYASLLAPYIRETSKTRFHVAGDKEQEAENCAAQLSSCKVEVRTLQKRVDAFDGLASRFQEDVSAANELARRSQAAEAQVGHQGNPPFPDV